MRGKKAKAIRRVVYGDISQRLPRRYSFVETVKTFISGVRRKLTMLNDQSSMRARYLKAKQLVRKGEPLT